MKVLNILTYLLIISSFSLTAQTQTSFVVQGRIVSVKNEPLEFATVALFATPSDSLVIGASSDENGKFQLQTLFSGSYKIKISSIGYLPFEKEITIKRNEDLGRIVLEENVTELSEITVMAHYTNRKLDGSFVTKIKGNPITKGKSVAQLLPFLPGLEVNNSDLKINGREGTIIFLGNRQISFQELNAIPTNLIERIEIIPMLGSEYGVNTNGGALRVYLREESGLMGSLSPNLQFDKDGLVESALSSSTMYRKGKFSLLNTLKAGYGRYTTNLHRIDENNNGIIDTRIKTINKENAIFDNLTLGYDFNKNHQLQLYGGVLLNNKTVDNISSVTKPDASTLKQYSEPQLTNYSGGLYYKHVIDENKSDVLLHIGYVRQESESSIDYNETINQKRLSNTDYISIDPRLNLNLKGKKQLKVGLLFNYLNDNNKSEGINLVNLDKITPNEYTISGADYGIWADYSQFLGDKFYLNAGVRYQGDKLNYTDFINPKANYNITYNGIYPTFKFQGILNQKKMSGFSLTYRHYFSLPNYGYYSPVVNYQSENFYSQGNPKLSKESFDLIELAYFINRKLTLTYQFNYGRNLIYILTYQDQDNPNIYFTMPENIGKRYRNRLIFNANLTPLKFWKSNNTITLGYNKEKGNNQAIDNTYAMFRSQNQFELSKNMGLTVNVNSATKQEMLNMTVMPTYRMSVGVFASFLKNNLWANLELSNLLHSNDEIRIKHPNFETVRTDLSHLSRLQLSISWTFNSGKKIRKIEQNSISMPNKETPIL